MIRHFRFLLLSLTVCFLVTSPVVAGEVNVQAELERIRLRMARIAREVAQGLIAEQTTDREKADAALIIATLYEMGRLDTDDPMLIVDYYRTASEYGSAEADCTLGGLYYSGLAIPGKKGVDRNLEKALEYFDEAATGGSVPAMQRLGLIYADGMGVEPDPKKALPYFRGAAERGDDLSLQRLEPVMRQAREWEEAKPGRKANFPTSREEMIQPALVKEVENRSARLERLLSRIFVEFSKRVGVAVKSDLPDVPVIVK